MASSIVTLKRMFHGPAPPGLHGEFVEESVLAVVRRPDGKVTAESNTALSGFPRRRALELANSVESDVAAVNGMGLGLAEKAMMREPLSNLMIDDLISLGEA